MLRKTVQDQLINMVTSRSICHYGPLLALSIIITLFLCGLYCTFLWFPPWASIAGAIHVTVFVSWVTLIIKYFLKSIWLGPGYLPLRWRLVSILILRTTEDENVCRQMEIATIVFWLCKNIYSYRERTREWKSEWTTVTNFHWRYHYRSSY